VLVDLHGGGWISGSKDIRALLAERIVAKGTILLAIDYGLAPEYSMDEIINHVRQAIARMYSNTAQYGGETNSLFIFGNSACAHLAASALMGGWMHHYNLPENAIKGAVLASGIYDLESQLHAKTGPQEHLKMTLKDAKSKSSAPFARRFFPYPCGLWSR
jgi:arylformamidase